MKWNPKYWYAVAVVVIPVTATAIYFIYRMYKIRSIVVTTPDEIPDTTNDHDMTDIIAFIKQHEGGWVNDPSDSGGETNKGITYSTWKSFFGDDHDRFMAMSDDDWYTIFKSLYWDKISGDDIQSITIANFLVDWYWGSGAYAVGMKYYGVKYGIQAVLNTMGYNLDVDGEIGAKTLDAINSADQAALYVALQNNRRAFYESIAANSPKDKKFLTGWLNRVGDLVA